MRVHAALSFLFALVAAHGQQPVPRPAAGEERADEALDEAHRWLLKHQEEDGRWSAALWGLHDPPGEYCPGVGKPDADLEVTCYCLIALLWKPQEHRESLQRGVEWVLEQQADDGLVGDRRAANSVVVHGLATFTVLMVLARPQTLTRSPERIESTHLAVRLLADLGNDDGSWSRGIGARGSDPEATVWGWQTLHAVQLVTHDRPLRDTPDVVDLFGSDEWTQEWIPAAKLLLSGDLGQADASKRDLLVRAIQKSAPCDGETAEVDLRCYLFGALALLPGEAPGWRDSLRSRLVDSQRRVGPCAGSWDPTDPRGRNLGRVYSTAVLASVLNLAQR